VKDLREEAKKHSAKLKNIKCALFDIDGVLTNGQVWYAENEGFNRYSNTHDGYALKLLMRNGIKVGVISGGDSLGVQKRFVENLKLDYGHFGNEDKIEAFKAVMNDGFKPEEILYMGDEFFDLPLLLKAGFSATTHRASYEIKERVDYIAETDPGMGCVREVIDMLRYAQDIYPEVHDFDGNLINFKSE